MGDATAWDIFIILVLLFVIFGRRLMPGMWRGLVRAVPGLSRSAAKPAANQEASAPAAPQAEKPDDDPGAKN